MENFNTRPQRLKTRPIFFSLSILATVLIGAKGQGCNQTEFYLQTGGSTVTRATNRCDATVCLYHSDCASNYCMKIDTVERISIEGLCAPKSTNSATSACSLTTTDITQQPELYQAKMALNRCEFVPCHDDKECASGLFCH